MTTERITSRGQLPLSAARRMRSKFFHGIAGLLLPLIGVVALDAGRPAHAQALNEEIIRLLERNCDALLGPNYDRALLPRDFGSNLAALCDFPVTVSGSSSGGGAASVQSSTTQITNSVLQRRLEGKRREQRGEESTETSWLFGRRAPTDREGFLLWAGPEDAAGQGEEPGGGLSSRRLGLYASGGFDQLDRDLSRFEDGYDSTIRGLTVGVDYRFADAFVAGIVATSSVQEGDFDGGGEFEIESLVPMVYASIVPSERTFIQLVAGVTSQEFEVDRDLIFLVGEENVVDPNLPPTTFRQLSGTTSSETDGKVVNAGAQFGYDRSAGSFTFGPRVSLNYSKTTVDGFTEMGGTGLEMLIEEFDVKSLQSVLGFYGSVALSGKSCVFQPQFNVEYVHEFEDEESRLSARFAEDFRGPSASVIGYQTNVPDADFFNVEVGASAILAHGIQPYVNLRAMLGNSNFNLLGGVVGIRFEL